VSLAALALSANILLTAPGDSNGWMSVLGWWLALGSVANFVSSMILEIAKAWYPDYDHQSWQAYLIYVALIWVAISTNIFASRWIPLFNKLMFVLAVITMTTTMIILFVMARNHHSPASTIFGDTTNRTGWSSDGFSFMLAVGNAVYSFLGSDCGAHMCEEVPNPAKNVPRIMLWPLLMGLLTAFPFATALLYALSDITKVLSTGGVPLLEIYYQGTGSLAGATVLLALFAFLFFSNLIANGEFDE
jgi:choline transport protein